MQICLLLVLSRSGLCFVWKPGDHLTMNSLYNINNDCQMTTNNIVFFLNMNKITYAISSCIFFNQLLFCIILYLFPSLLSTTVTVVSLYTS